MSSQHGSFFWQQVDHTLANLMLAEVSEEFLQLAHEDLQQIHYQNIGNGNGLTVPSQRLEMHRLRTDELAARYYAVYCEVWRSQQKALTPEFLRAICPNSLQMLRSARINGVSSEFSMEQMRTHSLNGEWLKSAMAEFKRSMDRLYAKWERQAEVDAKGLEYMLAAAPNNPDVDVAATQVVYARIQLRIVEARLISIKARIASCERALSATQLRPPDAYRIKSLEQHLEGLSTDKEQFESKRDDWQLRLNNALRSPGDREEHAASRAIVAARNPEKKRARPKPPCFAVAVKLLKQNRDLELVQFCREMDSKAAQYPSVLKYKPPTNWKVPTFFKQYQKRSNTVSRFLSEVRKHIRASTQG
jgi:hypothetical protein